MLLPLPLRTARWLAEIGPEVLRHALLALVAVMLAIPVRELNTVVHHLAHGGRDPQIASIQGWPSRGAVLR